MGQKGNFVHKLRKLNLREQVLLPSEPKNRGFKGYQKPFEIDYRDFKSVSMGLWRFQVNLDGFRGSQEPLKGSQGYLKAITGTSVDVAEMFQKISGSSKGFRLKRF